jgi:hypothetical protein
LDERRERKTKRRAVVSFPFLKKKKKKKRNRKKEDVCVSPQVVHEQLDGMRDLIFARHIFTNINIRRAFDMCG